jgi:thymidylate kinase
VSARLIYLLGADGSGKTTVAEHMEQHLRAGNRSVYRVWAALRPVILLPIIKVAKFLFVRKHNKFDNYSEHIKAKKEGLRRFRFFLKPLFYLSLLDYYPQYLWKVVRIGTKHDYLICDRYYVDLIMDQAITEGAGPERVTDWMRRYGHFFRTPDLALYLRTSPEVAIKRKTDIPSEAYLQERRRYYDAVAEALRAHVIDGDQPLPTVLARVQECIDDLDR